jgi:hypothetical protein
LNPKHAYWRYGSISSTSAAICRAGSRRRRSRST